MKVLQINTSDLHGGAALAAYRLHDGLIRQNITSNLLVGKVLGSDPLVHQIPRNNKIEALLGKVTKKFSLNYINIISTFRLHQHSLFQESDLINFHNLHLDYFNYLALPILTSKKPAVLTLHDMWHFTGHCIYSYDCERWQSGCGKCPYLDKTFSMRHDYSKVEFYLKKKSYQRSQLTLVSPSKWLIKQVEASILSQFPIHHIPYGLDTDIFKPYDKFLCRQKLNLPQDKKIVLYAAARLSDARKGVDLFLSTLRRFAAKSSEEVCLVTFGKDDHIVTKELNFQCINLGYIGDDFTKAQVFSAADIFLFPTRADNLPLILQESMACGTPMISFEVGGVPELVRPEITGLLAEPENTQHMCQQLIRILEDDDLRDHLSKWCRKISLLEYSLEIQAKRYKNIYSSLIAN